jgi:hypothetical protein
MAEFWPVLVGSVQTSSYFSHRTIDIDFAMN